jgi:D-glycerate 3-kinase
MPQAQPPIVDPDLLAALLALAHDRLDRTGPDHCVVLGISGSQGSGKTTLARALATAATAQGITTACLSLDDLYLTRAERLELSAKVHPLLATRGFPAPMTSRSACASSMRWIGETVVLPRFDKARDDRRPPAKRTAYRPAPGC